MATVVGETVHLLKVSRHTRQSQIAKLLKTTRPLIRYPPSP